MLTTPDEGSKADLEVCLTWYTKNEYEKVCARAAGGLLPYEVWLTHFTAARDEIVRQRGSVLVATVVADDLFKWASSIGLPLGPEAAATYAIAAVSGIVPADVRRFGGPTRH